MKRNYLSISRMILIILLCFLSNYIMAQKDNLGTYPIMGKKVNLDTLTVDELNLYRDKAVTLRNTGMIVTLAGIAVSVPCIIFITGCMLGDNIDDSFFVAGILAMVGIATTAVGIPLWAVGGNRKTKAELTLQKFNIAPENSMALGLGITITF